MRFELRGDGRAGPTLDLDHRVFAYAGKFVMSGTGKSVATDQGEIVGAVAFSQDRSDASAVRLRYVTVRDDRRGEGIGPRLLRFTAAEIGAEYERVLIAVNNPIAYQACYRAGFVFTGEETGIAEVLLVYDPARDRSREAYNAGLDAFDGRDLPATHQSVIDRHRGSEPPPAVDRPE
jgi:GNAT superfamily N-acetyltransferase